MDAYFFINEAIKRCANKFFVAVNSCNSIVDEKETF